MDMHSVHSLEQLIARAKLCPKGPSRERQWNMLIAKLQPIAAINFERVVRDMLDSSGERRRDEESFQLSKKELIELLGGFEGIKRLERNALILTHLAYLLQQEFHLTENISEQQFLDFRSLWWHVDRLRTSTTDRLEDSFDMYGRNIVIEYCRMVRQPSLAPFAVSQQ